MLLGIYFENVTEAEELISEVQSDHLPTKSHTTMIETKAEVTKSRSDAMELKELAADGSSAADQASAQIEHETSEVEQETNEVERDAFIGQENPAADIASTPV